ncbi:MAG: hypothetical protein WCV72_02975 [Patescibacteria group bacterium]
MTTAQTTSHEVAPVQMPRMLELEAFELREERTDFAASVKYKNWRAEYSAWQPDELISRMRILCVNARKNALEILAVYDEFQSH